MEPSGASCGAVVGFVVRGWISGMTSHKSDCLSYVRVGLLDEMAKHDREIHLPSVCREWRTEGGKFQPRVYFSSTFKFPFLRLLFTLTLCPWCWFSAPFYRPWTRCLSHNYWVAGVRGNWIPCGWAGNGYVYSDLEPKFSKAFVHPYSLKHLYI